MAQTQGEMGEKVGEERKEVDLTKTVGQEGLAVGLQEAGLGSGVVVGQEELEEECHKVTLQQLPLHLLQGAGNVHVHENWHGRVNASEPEQELQDQEWTPVGTPAHHS